MATLRTNAPRSHSAVQGTGQQATSAGRTEALRGDLERQVLLLHSILNASRLPAAPAQASEATTATMQSTRARDVREGTDVEELLRMKRLLAEKLGEKRPPTGQAKPFGLLLSKTVPRAQCQIEEDSVCGWSSPSSRSMSSSPQESPRPVARVLMKDGLAYVVR